MKPLLMTGATAMTTPQANVMDSSTLTIGDQLAAGSVRPHAGIPTSEQWRTEPEQNGRDAEAGRDGKGPRAVKEDVADEKQNRGHGEQQQDEPDDGIPTRDGHHPRLLTGAEQHAMGADRRDEHHDGGGREQQCD